MIRTRQTAATYSTNPEVDRFVRHCIRNGWISRSTPASMSGSERTELAKVLSKTRNNSVEEFVRNGNLQGTFDVDVDVEVSPKELGSVVSLALDLNPSLRLYEGQAANIIRTKEAKMLVRQFPVMPGITVSIGKTPGDASRKDIGIVFSNETTGELIGRVVLPVGQSGFLVQIVKYVGALPKLAKQVPCANTTEVNLAIAPYLKKAMRLDAQRRQSDEDTPQRPSGYGLDGTDPAKFERERRAAGVPEGSVSLGMKFPFNGKTYTLVGFVKPKVGGWLARATLPGMMTGDGYVHIKIKHLMEVIR